jgi:branched-chain amino acid transport system permease protein
MNYLLHILVMINIYVILALSLNLLVGYTGLLSLSHAAFYGIGAYISTLCIVVLGLPYILAVVLAVVGAIVLSLVISIPSLRLKSDYFVLASLSFQVIVFTVLYNWVELTRGPYGISNIPRPDLFLFNVNSLSAYFIYSAAITLICIGLLYLIGYSPFGRVLKAIRENEVATAAIGKNITLFKVVAFAIAAGFAAMAGTLFAGYMRYLDPTSFTVMESVFIISIIIIGGAGNIAGPIIGTILMITLPEALRFIGLPSTIAPNLRQMVYGILIILILRYKPQGIAGEYRFE